MLGYIFVHPLKSLIQPRLSVLCFLASKLTFVLDQVWLCKEARRVRAVRTYSLRDDLVFPLVVLEMLMETLTQILL